MTLRLVFVRHAESLANTIGSLDCTVPGPSLSSVGHQQAATLAGALPAALRADREDLPARAVWASTMLRAQQTAQPLADRVGLPLRIHPLLHEGHVGDLHARVDDEAHQALEDLLVCWQTEDGLNQCRPGGESGTVLVRRMRQVVADVLADLAPVTHAGQAPGPGVGVVVSHGAILRVALPRICEGVSPEHTLAHHLPNTSSAVVDVLDPESEPPKLVCRSWDGVPVG